MAQSGQYGAFVPTTNVWESQISQLNVNSPEFKQLIVNLYQNMNLIANVLNIKDSGYYVQEEFVDGQVYFPNPNLNSTTSNVPVFRQVFRKVINFGALPDTASKSVAHGIAINSSFSFTIIYATASDQVNFEYIPIPYASTSGDDIELFVDLTNVTIITLSNRSAFTLCYVVLEYIKQ